MDSDTSDESKEDVKKEQITYNIFNINIKAENVIYGDQGKIIVDGKQTAFSGKDENNWTSDCVGERTRSRSNRCSQSEQQYEVLLTSRSLHMIASHLLRDWQKVFLYLHMSHNEMIKIEDRFQGNTHRQAYEALIKWRNNCIKRHSQEKLVESLKDCFMKNERQDLIDFMDSLLLEKENIDPMMHVTEPLKYRSTIDISEVEVDNGASKEKTKKAKMDLESHWQRAGEGFDGFKENGSKKKGLKAKQMKTRMRTAEHVKCETVSSKAEENLCDIVWSSSEEDKSVEKSENFTKEEGWKTNLLNTPSKHQTTCHACGALSSKTKKKAKRSNLEDQMEEFHVPTRKAFKIWNQQDM